MKEIFTKSKDFRQEYCATVVKVGELKDIENSDNLKQAIIDGFSVVVNKNDVKEGDLMIYCKNETELNSDFLSVNNMYEIGCRELNKNFSEVEELIQNGNMDEAKMKVGYFNKHGRVKMIKLRGCPSMGVLIRLENLVKFDKRLEGLDLNDYITVDENGNFIPFDFDTINGKLFIQAYVPKITNTPGAHGSRNRRDKKVKKFDRMIPGEWHFHYDTQQLNSNMWKFNPDQEVVISVKLHGTSLVLGNCLVKNPVFLNPVQMLWNRNIRKRISKIQKALKTREKRCQRKDLEKEMNRIEEKLIKNYKICHDDIYSSRTVIKNGSVNKNVGGGYYGTDVWGEYFKLFKGHIPEGMTIYGEIVGYLSGSQTMIQKGYDYSCAPGTNKLMIYRITSKDHDGKIVEWNMSDVVRGTQILAENSPELKERLIMPTILYHGKLSDLYPQVNTAEHWNENVLAALKEEKKFGMEENEPLCKNKVPREGICLRIDNDPIAECFKLKCAKFLMKESAEIDKGSVDIEMADNYL